MVNGLIDEGHNSTKYPPALLSKASTTNSVKGWSEVMTTAISLPRVFVVVTTPPITVILFLQSETCNCKLPQLVVN